MNRLPLPSRIGDVPVPEVPSSRQITLVGGNGAGKSRFMEEVMRLTGDKAYSLSALRAGFPQRELSTSPGSIDALYLAMTRMQPYMRTDAVSEIDKLTYMLFADEFEYLLNLKNSENVAGRLKLRATRLDRLKRIWENLFPDNRVVRHNGQMMFSTGAGSDIIPISALSQGEQSVFYYIAGVLYAPKDAVIFIDSPSLFIHPSILNNLWNSIEQLRPDCTFVYDTVDENFVATRTSNVCIWVRNFDSENVAWDYEVLSSGNIPDDLFLDIIGSRRPILFIEGDARNSIDAKLYTLLFSDFSVRPLGSCDKVIETTRTFNDLRNMHHLSSRGIVDRDRRTELEVDYLRRKNILVPDVAEVENIFLLEGVIRIMAGVRGRNPHTVFSKVKRNVVGMFHSHAEEQALMHVRHKVKREVECKIDARFKSIREMETHIRGLLERLAPREHYLELRSEFEMMTRNEDYDGILKVFNHKPMLGDCGVASLLGYSSRDAYISGVLGVLKSDTPEAFALRDCIRYCFGIAPDTSVAPPVRKISRRALEGVPGKGEKERAAKAGKGGRKDKRSGRKGKTGKRGKSGKIMMDFGE